MFPMYVVPRDVSSYFGTQAMAERRPSLLYIERNSRFWMEIGRNLHYCFITGDGFQTKWAETLLEVVV